MRTRFISGATLALGEPHGAVLGLKEAMMNPGLIEAISQIFTGLQCIGDGLTVMIGFILDTMGVAASQQMIQMATIMILLSLVWKMGSKLTSSIFWFFIAAQAMSFIGTI